MAVVITLDLRHSLEKRSKSRKSNAKKTCVLLCFFFLPAPYVMNLFLWLVCKIVLLVVTRCLIEMSSAVQNFQCFLDVFQSEVWIDDPVEKKKLIEDYKSALRFTEKLCVLLWNQIYNALPLMFNDIQIWIYNFFSREKPCKYFAQGTRTCQFGASCFYKHGMEWNEKLCVLSLWRFFSSTGVT